MCESHLMTRVSWKLPVNNQQSGYWHQMLCPLAGLLPLHANRHSPEVPSLWVWSWAPEVWQCHSKVKKHSSYHWKAKLDEEDYFAAATHHLLSRDGFLPPASKVWVNEAMTILKVYAFNLTDILTVLSLPPHVKYSGLSHDLTTLSHGFSTIVFW